MKWGYFTNGESIPSIDSFTDGAHILVVCSPLNYISKAVSLEDLGWEVRDCIKAVLTDKTLQIGLFRKSFKGTVASNVLTNGCGGINIDISRIGSEIITTSVGAGFGGSFEGGKKERIESKNQGRFPANLILGMGVNNLMDSQSGDTSSTRIGNPKFGNKGGKMFGGAEQKVVSVSKDYKDVGGSSRFFYNFKSESEMKSYLVSLIKL